jgi:hypothetical protein
MSIFDKQIVLFEGKNKPAYQGIQNILREHNIKYKAFATDDQIMGGCCGLNCGTCGQKTSNTYSIFVREKDAETAKELIKQLNLLP